MGWINIGSIDADRTEWQLTQSFEGNLIKVVSDVTSPSSNFYNHRGLIALNYGLEDFFKIKVFYSNPRSQLFYFPNINFKNDKYLAIKNITSRKSNNQWAINCFVWEKIINN
jgi:hypothetical protein